MDVLARLRKYQDEYGWSDYRIAKEAGLSQGTVSNLFKRGHVPTIPTLEAICKALGITVSQFFSDNDFIELTPELNTLFENWAKLPEDKKDIILQIIKSYVK